MKDILKDPITEKYDSQAPVGTQVDTEHEIHKSSCAVRNVL